MLSCRARSPNKASLEVTHGSKEARCPFFPPYILHFQPLTSIFALSFSFFSFLFLPFFLPSLFFLSFFITIFLLNFSFFSASELHFIFLVSVSLLFSGRFHSFKVALTLSCRLKLRYTGARIRKTYARNSDRYLYKREVIPASEGSVSTDQMAFPSNFS